MEYAIKISLEEAEKLLELSTDFESELKEVVSLVNKVLVPQVIWKSYRIDSLDKTGFMVQNKVFHCGGKVCKALEASTQLVFFVVTVGDKITDLITQYNKEYDFLKAYWCDKLANWALDCVVEKMKQNLAVLYRKENLKITSNWGPGYCGWSISEQASLLDLLPVDKLQVTLSSSMLMHPVKSLSGVIGIGSKVTYKKSGCADCALQHCVYRSLKW